MKNLLTLLILIPFCINAQTRGYTVDTEEIKLNGSQIREFYTLSPNDTIVSKSYVDSKLKEAGAFKITQAFSPAVVRNAEMNNIVPFEQTTALKVITKTTTTLTLNHIPDLTRGIDWYIQSLEASNAVDISFSGDYTVHRKVVSMDGNTVTMSSTTSFNVGDRVYFYSPFANYEFIDGQETSPLLTSESGTYMSTYISAGTSWFDGKNNRYVLLINGRSPDNQVGYAYSTDLKTWTHGNSKLPVIKNDYHSYFAKNVYSSGSAIDIGNNRVAFFLTGYDVSDNRRIFYAEVNRDMTGLTVNTTPLTSELTHISPAVTKWNDEYHMLVENRNVSDLKNSKVEHYKSTNLSSGWTKVGEFGLEYNDHNSIWLEGHSDNFLLFTENGGLYAFVAGTSRYKTSGTRADRVVGLMTYDKSANKWTPLNSFAPEIIAPMYLQDMGDPWGVWAGSHTGGYPSMLRRGEECLMFFSFERVGDNYGIGLIRLKNNSKQYKPVVAYDNLVPSVLMGTSPNYRQNNNINATIELTGNTTITMPDDLAFGQSGNISVSAATTSYTLTLTGYTIDIATYLNATGDAIPIKYPKMVISWWYDGDAIKVNGTKYE